MSSPASEPELRIGVVGATGAVGRVTLQLLLDRGYGNIRTFASWRSAGGLLGDFEVEEATPVALGAGDLDVCLFSVGTQWSRELVPPTAAAGTICIDKSSDLDLVITADPIEDQSLAYLPLFSYEALLAMPRNHPLAARPWVEPADLAGETLITYPVDRSRLDVFTSSLEPVGVEPARVRTAELTAMMIQLVASGRGLVCLPNWALDEYLERDYVVARSLGEEGVWPTLYAAVRQDQADAPFVRGFVEVAKATCFGSLVGIVTADVPE